MKLLLIALAMLLTLLSAAVAEDAPIKWGRRTPSSPTLRRASCPSGRKCRIS